MDRRTEAVLYRNEDRSFPKNFPVRQFVHHPTECCDDRFLQLRDEAIRTPDNRTTSIPSDHFFFPMYRWRAASRANTLFRSPEISFSKHFIFVFSCIHSTAYDLTFSPIWRGEAPSPPSDPPTPARRVKKSVDYHSLLLALITHSLIFSVISVGINKLQ